MLNRILIFTLLMLVLVGGTAMADKGGDDGTTQKVLVRVATEGEIAPEADAAEEARKAFAIAVEQLEAAPGVSAWVVGDELSEMMLIDRSKLEQAHKKLLEAMTRLRETNDLTAEGMNKLEALLEELAADLESHRHGSAVGKAIQLSAPEIDMREVEEHKVIIRQLMEESGEAPRQLQIIIDGEEIEVEGEGISAEELAEIERKIAAGEHGIVTGHDSMIFGLPGYKLEGLSAEELHELQLKEGELELELKMLDEKLEELNLENHELRPLGGPLPDGAHGLFMELAPQWHSADPDDWHKEWQALEEELSQILSDEQLARLHKLRQERSWPAPHAPGHVYEFFGQREGDFPAPNWEEHHDIFRNYAPEASPFFEWHGQEPGEDWEAELEQMMAEIEQMMKELMQRYQEHSG
jgi:hypothetical protein